MRRTHGTPRFALALAFAFVSLLLSTRARADLPTRVDCYFVAGPVPCQALRDALVASVPYVRPVPAHQDLTVTMRSFELDRNFKYVLTFTGTGDKPTFTIVELGVTKTTTADGALTLLEADLVKGLAPFLGTVTAPTTEDGVTTLLLADPKAAAGAQAGEDSTRWYVKLGASAGFVSGTTSILAGGGTSEVNWSGKNQRFNLAMLASVNHVTVDFGNNNEESADATLFKQRAIFAQNLSEQWSLAGIATYGHDSRNNLQVDAKAEVGAEWDLVPMLATNDHSFGLRYVIGAERQGYVNPNIENVYTRTFAENYLGVFLTWHFTDVDISANLDGASILGSPTYASTSGDLTFLWRLSERFSVLLVANAAYRSAIVNQPLTAPADGLDQLVGGGDYLPFTYGSTFSFEYTFGNVGLSRQDQRWRLSALVPEGQGQ